MAAVSLQGPDGTVDDCIRTALCALAGPVRGALQATVQGLMAQATGQLAVARGVLAQLQVLTFPADIVIGAINGVRETLINTLSIDTVIGLPTPGSTAETCFSLAQLRVSVGDQIDKLIKPLDDLKVEFARPLAALRSAEQAVADLEQYLANYQLTLDFLEQCP